MHVNYVTLYYFYGNKLKPLQFDLVIVIVVIVAVVSVVT